MKLPELKLHATGVYFCYWGGKSRYFSIDAQASRAAYLAHIHSEYLPWKQARESRRLATRSRWTIVDLAQAWLEDLHVARQREPETINTYRRMLTQLLHACGQLPADAFNVELLRAIVSDVRDRYSPKSLNHIIITIKMLFAWGAANNRIPPINLAGVRLIDLEPPNPAVFPPGAVRSIIAAAGAWHADDPEAPARFRAADAQLAHWLSVTYLAALRPTETHRLAHRQGVMLERSPAGGIYQLARSKTGRSTGRHRLLILSPEALRHADALEPRWVAEDGFSLACRRAVGAIGWPHALRHSAATHLENLGAREEDIRRILGHRAPAVFENYVRIARQRLLPTAARLTLQPSPAGSSASAPPPNHEELGWAS